MFCDSVNVILEIQIYAHRGLLVIKFVLLCVFQLGDLQGQKEK